MAKKADKLIYVTTENTEDHPMQIISESIDSAWHSVAGDTVTVEIYRLVRVVEVTQNPTTYTQTEL